MKKLRLPITVKVVNDDADYIVPLSIIFLALVVSGTIIFLAVA